MDIFSSLMCHRFNFFIPYMPLPSLSFWRQWHRGDGKFKTMALKGCSNFQWHIGDELHFSVAYSEFTQEIAKSAWVGAGKAKHRRADAWPGWLPGWPLTTCRPSHRWRWSTTPLLPALPIKGQRACLVHEFFWVFGTVALLLLFDN